jgi:hypothetical protein
LSGNLWKGEGKKVDGEEGKEEVEGVKWRCFKGLVSWSYRQGRRKKEVLRD